MCVRGGGGACVYVEVVHVCTWGWWCMCVRGGSACVYVGVVVHVCMCARVEAYVWLGTVCVSLSQYFESCCFHLSTFKTSL